MIRSQRSPYGTSLLGAGAVHHIKPGKAQIEQKFSGVPRATDIRQRDWHVGAICRHMQTYADIQTPGDAIILDLMNCRR